jgi:hypothetical protein
MYGINCTLARYLKKRIPHRSTLLEGGKIAALETEGCMSAAYQHLALAQVKPGMILSDVLLDRQGQVLLPQGFVLTAKMIALLPGHGIDVLAVLRSDADAPPPVEIDTAAVEARLDYLFRKNDIDNNDDWATGILRRYVSDYRLGREIAP